MECTPHRSAALTLLLVSFALVAAGCDRRDDNDNMPSTGNTGTVTTTPTTPSTTLPAMVPDTAASAASQ